MINMKTKRFFRFAVLLALSASVSVSVADQAPTVVVGEILSGRQSGNLAVFTLSVVRTLKGSANPGDTITVNAAVSQSADRDLTGAYGMWFLSSASGQPTLLPVLRGVFDTAYYPFSKTTSPAAITTNSPAVTLDDQIALENGAALASYSTPLQFHLLAAGLLATADSPVTQNVFQFLHSSADPELRFIALARWVRNHGDTSALAEVANNIALTPSLEATFFVVPGVLGRLDSDPVAIGYLGKIAGSSQPDLQRAAATALMHIHTGDTLPYLAQLLGSSDAATREIAMRGLSRFVDNLPIATQGNVLNGKASLQQGPTPYRTAQTDRYSLSTRSLAQASDSEAAFLQFWESWWASMKGQLSP
ncbi:MAG: HEAT repeat domain-containing protein [Bryobacteraceae bacterium]|jgi:hypothetical protein